MEITISTDSGQLDLALIHRFLAGSYWARGIPRDVVERSIRGSLCFGAYADGKQVGFARVITDQATFAYLADVFIVEDWRGRGLGRRLVGAVMADERLQGLRRWCLVTRDAHALYAEFGFAHLAAPERFMEIVDPHVYER